MVARVVPSGPSEEGGKEYKRVKNNFLFEFFFFLEHACQNIEFKRSFPKVLTLGLFKFLKF